MLCKAEVSFAGEIVMVKGQIRDIAEGDMLADLLSCGYVTPADNENEVKSDEAERGNTRKRKKNAES